MGKKHKKKAPVDSAPQGDPASILQAPIPPEISTFKMDEIDEEAPATPQNDSHLGASPKNTPKSIFNTLFTNTGDSQGSPKNVRSIKTDLTEDFEKVTPSIQQIFAEQVNDLEQSKEDQPEWEREIQKHMEKQTEVSSELREFFEKAQQKNEKLMEEIKVVHNLLQQTEALNKEMNAKYDRLERETNKVTIITTDDRGSASWYLVAGLTFIITVCIVTIITNYNSRRAIMFGVPPS
jgi:hypothetical protein